MIKRERIRVAFEAWIKRSNDLAGKNLARFPNSMSYTSWETQMLWMAFQAGVEASDGLKREAESDQDA